MVRCTLPRGLAVVLLALTLALQPAGLAHFTSGGDGTAAAGPPEGKGPDHKGRGRNGPPAHAGGGPPPWAPAHGYRAKHGGYQERTLVLESGRSIDRTFGVLDGTCNRELIGQVLGGAVGAAAGSQIGSGSGQTAAIIGGTILGVLIGGEIGRSMDAADQKCVGQTLEHAEQGQTVAWRNPDDGVRYRVTPTDTFQRDDGRYCREYTSTAIVGGRERTTTGIACRQSDGTWELRS